MAEFTPDRGEHSGPAMLRELRAGASWSTLS
ncbi:MAG: hypothetical protein ACI9AO_001463, partial [Ilumatobacter sp.]